MRKTFIFVLALVASFGISAQDWVEGMQDHTVNFYDVQSDFNKYAEKHKRGIFNTKSGNPPGFAQYKRWEAFWEPRVAPTGERPNPGILWQEMYGTGGVQAGGNSSTAGISGRIGTWTPRGPFDGPTGTGTPGGIGRVNCITFHPTNNDIVWIGSPSGGLWQSLDSGQTWTTNTDLLPNLGVSSIAIDPQHPDTMYIATGDRDADDTYSYGVLKSVDGGLTWNTTGLSYTVQQQRRPGGIVIDPVNTQRVTVATRSGIYQSTDGGTTFLNVQGGSFHTIKMDPQNPDKLFAGTIGIGRVFRSTDGGANWSQLTTGLPSSGTYRVEIAISPQDSNYIYAVFSDFRDYEGLYRTTDGGDSWTLRSSSPNLFNGSASGSGSGNGQAWYDMALAVSPTNKNQVFVGGVNIWRSNNGGASNTWTNVSTWYIQQDAHADIHYFTWRPGTDQLYTGTDGGVFVTGNAGTSWTPLYDGLDITQYYKISQSTSNPNLMLGGSQDNGTHRLSGSTWSRRRGGDGMDNAIDPDNHNIMYCSTQYGNFAKSTNGGSTFGSMNINGNSNGPWVTQFEIDPVNANILYAGYDQLFRSTNKGASWVATSGSINGSDIDYIAVAPSNNQTIYVAINSSIFKSTDWGNSWTSVKGNLPGNTNITGIAISPTDENHIWVTRSSYVNGRKVHESTTGGNTWTNISGSLANLPVNCIIYQEGTLDGVYIGTDVGVFYRDATMNDWVDYREGLPNLIVNDLEIYYAGGKIRAGTYGRGVWESDLITAFLGAPVADFVASPFATCSINDTITLQDRSENIPTSWKWDIYPGTFQFVNGTTDSSRNPQIVFTATDQYSVTLTATNGYGTDQEIKTRYLGVGGAELPFVETFENLSNLNSWEIDNPDGGITWNSSTVSGSSPGNTAMFIDHYNYSGSGQKDALISPPLRLIGYSNINLTFDHAYARYDNSSNDSLKVYISTDCGQSWTLLQGYGENGNGNWATSSNKTTAFNPLSANDWCGSSASATCKTISLNAYAGFDQVRIKFEAVNGYGNNIYLDNINIDGSPTAKPTADFIGQTMVCSIDTVSFADVSSNKPTSWNWSFPGATPAASSSPNPQVVYATGGTYTVTLISGNANGTDTIVKTSFVTVDQAVTPAISITASNDTICSNETVTLTPNAINAGNNAEYTWYKNGVYESNTNGPLVVSNAFNGDVYELVLRSSLDCITADSVISNSLILNVKPAPNVQLPSFSSACVADAPIPLSGGTPAGGTYSGPGVSNGIFDPAVAGVGNHEITYMYTSNNGCASSDAEFINVNDGPPKPNVTYNNLVLVADPIAPVYSYQWLDWAGNPIPGATDTAFIPWQTGNYSVELTFLNGCTNVSDPYTVSVVGIDENTFDSEFSVYPNPAKTQLTVSFALQSANTITTKVIDITGRVLMQQSEDFGIGVHTNALNIEELPAGTYVIQLSSDEDAVQRRFIKQ